MKIDDLGRLDGDILLFGGVYSNLHALKALITEADKAGIPAQNAICTGDVVAYCADAEGSVARIRDWGCPILKGNCEAQLAEDADDCGCGFGDGSQCSILSKGWYEHARRTVPAEAKAWLGTLPDRIVFRHNGLRYVVIHGGASDISRFLWPTTGNDVLLHEISLLRNEVGAIDCVISGHSGIGFAKEIDGVQWINAGAIGMPAHNGRQETSFVILSDDRIENKILHYDVHAQYQEMQHVGLVQGYDKALITGYWPSEDTLPPDMRLGRTG